MDETPAFWEGADDDILEAFGAVPAEYRPREGGPVALEVIFRRSRGQVQLTGPGLARREAVGAPSFTAKGPRHVLADAREGERLLVKGEAYTISNVTFGGVGLVTLQLQGPIVEPASHQTAGPAGGR